MFTALKRIANSKTDIRDMNRSTRPITSMSTNLQKKFSRGVQYNMKIIIKGDKCSGKTSLFRRLQGKNLEEDYKPTEGIQVAVVQWNYKNIDDVVKVEVWDVVDKGKKIPFDVGESVNASLDAEFLDVYKGTNGVLLVMDITKNWTFTYVQNEITKIPLNIPILILGNRCDMGHHQKISEDSVQNFIDSVQRPHDMAQIKYTESSMVNGFGLKYIYKFLALPFLHLQRSVLMGQLDRNAEEIHIALQEIDVFQTSEDADYSKFANKLSLKRRKNAEDLGISLKSSNSRTPSVIFGLGCPINRYAPFRKTTQGQPIDDSRQLTLDHQNSTKEVVTVEGFVPDEEQLDDNFFRESPSSYSAQTSGQLNECSDSDSQGGANPLVANFQEDVDPNDEFYHFPISTKTDGHFESNLEADMKPSVKFKRGTSATQPEMSYEDSSRIRLANKRCSDSNPKKQTKSINKGMEGTYVVTKKNMKSRGGKRLEASEADPFNSSKGQRNHKKKLKEENRTSKNKMKNSTVFLLTE